MRALVMALSLAALTTVTPRNAASQCTDWTQQPTILPGTGIYFARNGATLYTVGASGDLLVVDLTDPLRPAVANSIVASPGAGQVEVDGSSLYIATTAGVDIYDLTDPLVPALIASLATPLPALDMAAEGPSLWAVSTTEMYTFDVTDPLAGVLVHTEPVPSQYFFFGVEAVPDVPGLIAVGKRSAPNPSYYNWEGVDISVPAAPAFLGVVVVGGSFAVSGGTSVSGYNQNDPSGTQAIFYSEAVQFPAFPTKSINLGYGFLSRAVCLSDPSTVFWCTTQFGGPILLRQIDVTDPTITPVQTGSFTLPLWMYSMEVDGDTLFGRTNPGFLSLDLSGASADFLSPIGTLAQVAYASDFALDATTGWLMDGGTLALIDLTDPAAPFRMGSTAISGAYVDTEGTTGWVTSGHDFIVVDATDPMNPVEVSTFTNDLGAYLYKLEVEGGLAHIATSDGYQRLNVTNPAATTPAGFLDLGTAANDVALWDGFAYVTTDSTVEMLDVLQAPQHRHTFTQIVGTPEEIVARDGLAYVAADGLFILSLPPGGGNPPPPTLLSQFDLPLGCQEIALDGDVAYLSTTRVVTRVIYAIDISDPTQPTLISVLPNVGGRLAVGAGVLWTARAFAGGTGPAELRALPAHCVSGATSVTVRTTGPVRLSAAPNPTRGGTDIRFSIRSRGRVRLTVHDVTGRLVATLVDGPATRGEHLAAWDGRETTGAPVPAGIYFVRLDAEGTQDSRKVVMLR